MNIFDWLIGCFSKRGKARFLYKRGMAKAKKRNHTGAISDYTTTIGLPGTPADLIAMVLYNRALVYVTVGDNGKGVADLNAVLAMNDVLVNVKTMARQKLFRMESRSTNRNV